MITENLSTLKIHKLTQEQYNRELSLGALDENALYLTPVGHGIVTTRNYQTVVGMFNKKDTDTDALFVVGNGDGDDFSSRSNAFTVTKSGDIFCGKFTSADAGKFVTIGQNGELIVATIKVGSSY